MAGTELTLAIAIPLVGVALAGLRIVVLNGIKATMKDSLLPPVLRAIDKVEAKVDLLDARMNQGAEETENIRQDIRRHEDRIWRLEQRQ